MTIAKEPVAAIRPAVNPSWYPMATIAGKSMTPRAAVSAGPEPDIPAKIIPTTMVTIARPPGIGPTMRLTKRISLFDIPQRSRIRPARIKKGRASN